MPPKQRGIIQSSELVESSRTFLPAKFGGKQHASSYLCANLMCDDIHPNIRSKFHKKFGKTKQRNWGRLWARLNQELGL